MNTSIAVAVFVVVAVCALVFLYIRKRSSKKQSLSSNSTAKIQEESANIVTISPEERPTKIVFGESANQPALILQAAQTLPTKGSKKLDIKLGPIAKLSALLQAVPSMLVANEAAGKALYEVTIKGDLIKTASGNGFRAIAVNDAGKIIEHATLFDTNKLQTMINSAAIWQVASVVVAQKHLADISEKLEEIKKDIQEVRLFLEDGQRAKLTATYKYLQQAYVALNEGELSESVRNQLEDCERDLLQLQEHLFARYNCKLTQGRRT